MRAADLAQARRDLARDETLSKRNVIATKVRDDAITSVPAGRANVLRRRGPRESLFRPDR